MGKQNSRVAQQECVLGISTSTTDATTNATIIMASVTTASSAIVKSATTTTTATATAAATAATTTPTDFVNILAVIVFHHFGAVKGRSPCTSVKRNRPLLKKKVLSLTSYNTDFFFL